VKIRLVALEAEKARMSRAVGNRLCGSSAFTSRLLLDKEMTSFTFASSASQRSSERGERELLRALTVECARLQRLSLHLGKLALSVGCSRNNDDELLLCSLMMFTQLHTLHVDQLSCDDADLRRIATHLPKLA
jgi:hypothetical protein